MKAILFAQTAALAGSALGASIAPRAFWQPKVNTTWQIVLYEPLAIDDSTRSITPNVDVFDIDLWDNTDDGEVSDTINNLKRLGKTVVCYFSAGSFEQDRELPDSNQFQPADIGAKMIGWNESWVDLRSANIRKIMANRIDVAAKRGCDAVDPDNVDAYGENGGGLGLVEADSISFVKFLANEAHSRNMAIGLKNAAEIIDEVIGDVEFSVNEECAVVGDCNDFKKFTRAGKPVFHIEYPNAPDDESHAPVQNRAKWCTTAPDGTVITDFSTVIKNGNLDGWVQYCDGTVATTPTLG
jgi:hypothetical protein